MQVCFYLASKGTNNIARGKHFTLMVMQDVVVAYSQDFFSPKGPLTKIYRIHSCIYKSSKPKICYVNKFKMFKLYLARFPLASVGPPNKFHNLLLSSALYLLF